MSVNPLPGDLGDVAVWDEGAEAPRARREDEGTQPGVDPESYNLFVLAPAIGVSLPAFACRSIHFSRDICSAGIDPQR